LIELGRNLEEVRVDVLSEGSRGVFGIGTEEARVRVSVPDSIINVEDNSMEIIKDTLENILDKMGVDAMVTYEEGITLIDDEDRSTPSVFNVEGDDLGILIGRRGQTLACLQYIVKIIAANIIKESLPSIIIDINGYKQKRYQVLKEMAEHVAEQVANSGGHLRWSYACLRKADHSCCLSRHPTF